MFFLRKEMCRNIATFWKKITFDKLFIKFDEKTLIPNSIQVFRIVENLILYLTSEYLSLSSYIVRRKVKKITKCLEIY